ncbi:phenylalanine--tRNA ligase alpha subunit-like [Ylistrum balloti]|uniref:phenylalanine--tRNA ligase alpha subunit-like n=1 Tax=Ylistrum balloti TaxID=509963 RepID=UPI002905918E|nr:phenylalanine--tRNA ligase alpha subunit-like [Ylistrum balloti]
MHNNMAELSELVLKAVDRTEGVDTKDIASQLNVDHQKVVGTVKSLQSLEGVITAEQCVEKCWQLTEEGKKIAEGGSHEALVYYAVPSDGVTQAEIMKSVPNAKVGFSKAMQNGWIQIDKKAEGGPRVTKKVDNISDTVQECLKRVEQGKDDMTDAQKAECKKRKLITEIKLTSYQLRKGPVFTLSVQKQEVDLTPEMIQNGTWKDKSFKEYNFDALGVPPNCGHLHPLLKVRAEYRQIFLEMGFTEMPTNNFVESCFWNFDALFQPQQHPARDAHDTFFVSDPQFAHEFPMDYLARVKKVHSEGGYGSQGYNCDWKLEEAKKNILRTHTTAVSSRMLYKIAQQEEFKPVKYFSIDRVFRNEATDATHLAEFHQIEGVVADRGMTLGDLMGIIKEFFKKLGIDEICFKPAYNPYTEPSMEIFGYHDGLQKWVELGNSGIFRPEMLLPMGLPDDVSVIAWGLSLERPTMIKYKIDDIRTLIGPKVDLQMVYNNPICRLDK